MEAAAHLFQQHGYAAVSVRMIAAEAKVTTGSLYYHFRDKDEIVRVILDAGHRRIIEEVSSALDRLDPEADLATRIRVGIRAHLAALFERDSFPAANIRIYAHVPSHIRKSVRSGRKDYERLWRDIFAADRSAEQPVDPLRLTMFLLGAANWSMEWYRPEAASLDEIAHDLAITFDAMRRSG